jgi:hypothetical protein
MATGFVDRYKGKTAQPIGGMFIGGVQVNTTGPDCNTSVGWGTAPLSTSSTTNSPNAIQLSTTRTGGVDLLWPGANGGGGSIYRMPPPFAGANKVISYSTINGSTVLFLTLSTAGSVTLQGVGSTGSTASFAGTGGSTLTNTIKSTVSCLITLVGISTAAWLFESVVPSTTGHLTFSTTT